MRNEAAKHHELGVRAYKNGDTGMCLHHFVRAMELDAGNFDAVYNFAVATYEVALKRGDDDVIHMVAQLYERILALRPDDVEVMVNLGVIYNNQTSLRRSGRARELFERAITNAPEYGLAWLNLGLYWGFEGGCREMGDVVKRIALSGHAETVEVKMGCLELAARCFDKAFQLEPSLRRTFKACEDAVITLIELAKKYERPR